MNTEQLARFLTALERIADTTVRIADALEQPDQYQRGYLAGAVEGQARIEPTDTPTTKGPYR